MSSRQRTRYARIVGAVVVFLIVIFLLAPGDNVERVEKFVTGKLITVLRRSWL
jgi:hypothetical protein